MKKVTPEKVFILILVAFILFSSFYLLNQIPKSIPPTFEIKYPTAKEIVNPEPQSDYCLTHLCKG